MTEEQGYKDHIAALEARRDALEREVDALETVVRGLAAEGLQPLVDRMRLKLRAMKTLVQAMALAINELLEPPGNAEK